MPQDYTVDYEEGIKDPVGMSGGEVGSGTFHNHYSAKPARSIILISCVRRGGLGNWRSDFGTAEFKALLCWVMKKKEAGVCLIDIGGGTTDIAVFHDSIIRHTSSDSIWWENIFKLLIFNMAWWWWQKQAEQLKTRFWKKRLAEEASPNEIVSIPGIRNRTAKEISVKKLE